MHLTERHHNTWYGDVKTIFRECDLLSFFNIDLSQTISAKNLVDKVKQRLMNILERQWTESVLQSPKLRTYHIFKSSIGKEDYLSIQQRSALARFCCGSFLLAVEFLDAIDDQLSPLNNKLAIYAIVDKLKMRNTF